MTPAISPPPVVLLSGPTEARTHAVLARLVASTHSLAVVDVGLLRAMVYAPGDDQWNAEALQRLAIHNACLVARNVVAAGLSVVIADDDSEETAPLYRSLLADLHPRVMHLSVMENASTSKDGIRGDVEPLHSRSFGAGAGLEEAEKLDSSHLTTIELATALVQLVAPLENSSPAERPFRR